MIPLFERSDHLLEALAFGAMGAAIAYAVLAWRLRKRPDHAVAAPGVAIALGVACLAFLPEGGWRLESLAAGVMAVGLVMVLARWKKPDGKNACARDMDKMSRWGGDK